MPEEFTIGNYTLSRSEFDQSRIWIENEVGEGIEISEKQFMDLIGKCLNDFFEENF